MDRPDVFMPLYIGDYLAGTSRLTTEQHGAYLLLIMDYWMNGPLPDNDQVLASICKCSPDAWSMLRASLEHFFSIDQGQWKHKRIEQELDKATEKKRLAKEKAAKAAAARWEKREKPPEAPPSNPTSDATSTAQAMHEECPSPSPSPSQEKQIKKPSSGSGEPSPKKQKKYSDADLECAEWMHNEILHVIPDYKKPNLERWAEDIRLAREQDGRSHDQLKTVWRWCRADSFENANVQSPGKLRARFDNLKAKAMASATPGGSSSQGSPRVARIGPATTRDKPLLEDLTDRSWAQ